MIVYRDIISGDEMLSDAFKLLPVVDAEGNVVEGLMMCASKMKVKAGDDVDVGCGNAFGGGGEEEGGGGGGADAPVKVNDVIDGFQYTETQIGTANDLKSWLKDYFGAVLAKLKEKGKPKEELQAFRGSASNIAKYLITNFSDVQFYLGPSFCSESMCFSIYPEGSETPNFYYIMGGLVAEKF